MDMRPYHRRRPITSGGMGLFLTDKAFQRIVAWAESEAAASKAEGRSADE